jgi:large subunit ribosomal protein L18
MRNRTLIRQKRNRSKLKRVNKDMPRLTVFRSAKNIYVQLIDDTKRVTIASASSKEKTIEKNNKTELSKVVGKLIAERSIEKGIKEVYFDRGSYRYHGSSKRTEISCRTKG